LQQGELLAFWDGGLKKKAVFSSKNELERRRRKQVKSFSFPLTAVVLRGLHYSHLSAVAA